MLRCKISLLMVENLRKKQQKAKGNSFFLPATPATTASREIQSATPKKKIILINKRILLPFQILLIFFYIEYSQSVFIIGNYIKLYLLLLFDIESTLEKNDYFFSKLLNYSLSTFWAVYFCCFSNAKLEN